MSTGISSSSAEKSGYYASETASRVSNHYESSTIIKQVAAASQPVVEKVPLDYECPKQSTPTAKPTVQNDLSGDCDEVASKVNASEGNAMKEKAASNGISSSGGVREEAVVVVETAFSGDANASDPQQKETGDN